MAGLYTRAACRYRGHYVTRPAAPAAPRLTIELSRLSINRIIGEWPAWWHKHGARRPKVCAVTLRR